MIKEKPLSEKLNGNKIYPKDIFPEIERNTLKRCNDYLNVYGLSIDRLSAHISRKLLKNIKEDVIKAVQKAQEMLKEECGYRIINEDGTLDRANFNYILKKVFKECFGFKEERK